MNLKFMRMVDFWIGVPLTFLLSLALAPLQFFKKNTSSKKIKKVVCIELSEMGSAILADAALKKIANRYELYFVIFKKNAVSLRLFNSVPAENVFTIRDDSFLALTKDTFMFLLWCRKNKMDAVVDLELFSRFTALLSGLSGAWMRIGYIIPNGEGLYRGSFLTHRVAYNSHLHISKNFISLVEPLFSNLDNNYYVKRTISDQEIAFSENSPSDDSLLNVKKAIINVYPSYSSKTAIVLLNINVGDLLPQRRWPLQNFVQLAKKILDAHPEHLLLLTGSPNERAHITTAEKLINSERCINFAGNVRFEELPALYSLSTLIVTGDSGPAHFASASGLKTFALFGPETPILYGPKQNATVITSEMACSPCVTANNHRNTACTNNVCMQKITPEQVFHLVDAYLKEKANIASVH